jgi:hypothetical protein
VLENVEKIATDTSWTRRTVEDRDQHELGALEFPGKLVPAKDLSILSSYSAKTLPAAFGQTHRAVSPSADGGSVQLQNN